MITADTMFKIKNRSSSMVVYSFSDTGLRRAFQPGETKKVPYSELEKLTYQPGGRKLLEDFLQILDSDEEVTRELEMRREIEYDMSEEDIQQLILSGSVDAFLDALDFAPQGVIDLIKMYSVQLPLTDLNKRQALKEKTGFDVDLAIANQQKEKEEETPKQATEAPRRRVTQEPTRRTTSNYKVVSKKE